MMSWTTFRKILCLEFATNLRESNRKVFRNHFQIWDSDWSREKLLSIKVKTCKEMEELETALKRVEKKGLKDKMRGNESLLMSHE